MTLQDLRQFRSLKAEGRRISKRLHELRLEATKTDDAEYTQQIKALYSELERLQKKQIAAELKITKQIENITDAQVRASIEMHYIDGQTWNEVADAIGGNNTEDSCRKYVTRYIKKLSDMSQQ